jgi:Tol biopolymer transport system component
VRIVAAALLAIGVSGFVPTTGTGAHRNLVAFERGSTDGKRTDLYLMNIDGTGVHRLTTIGRAENADWSRDGRRIAFDVYRPSRRLGRYGIGPADVFVMNADGSDVRRLTTDGISSHPDWSPDGRKILFDRGDGLAVMNADGTDRHTLIAELGTGAEEDGAWSPDSRRIAFSQQRRSSGGSGLSIMNVTDGSVRLLTNRTPLGGHYYDTDPDWSPDGQKIAYTAEFDCGCEDGTSGFNIDVVSANPDKPEHPTELTTDLISQHPSWSTDGRRIAYDRGRYDSPHQIHVMDANGKHKRRLTTSRESSEQPALSP